MSAVIRPPEVPLPPVANGRVVYRSAWQKGWRIPERLPLDDWADKNRVLPREGSSEPGRFRVERTPYVREIMQVLSPDHPAKRVVWMSSTQVAKTETGNNWLGYIFHQAPGPVMAIQPTQNLGKRYSKQRIDPMIEHTPVLRERIKPARSRDSGNTTLMKEFPGGILVIAGANSAVDLRSLPARYVFADEVDGYPDDVDGEGDPLTLAERRQSTFPRRKLFATSTPTIKDASRIEREFLGGDQRRYYVPCPHCDHSQVLRDENLQDDGTYLCEGCGRSIEHHQKTRMLERGEWIAENPEGAYPSFHLSALYAPIGLGYTWAEIAEERRKAFASGDRHAIQVYVNTLLGEAYEDESGKVDWQEVRERAGGFARREIPDGCLLLTAGVDVQDDRFAIHITGFGPAWSDESLYLRTWTVDYFEIPAEPGLEDEWLKIDKHALEPTFRNAYGVELRVTAAAIDTGGHHTQNAYNFCRARKSRLVLAIKGDRYPNKPIIASRPRPQDITARGRTVRHGVDLWFVGTDTAKGWIFSRLHADADKAPEDCRVRFPRDLDDEYYQQLTSERFDAPANRWRKLTGRRNEVLDCYVYSLAAAHHPAIRVSQLREADWQKLLEQVQPKNLDMFSRPAPAPRGRRFRSSGIDMSSR